MDLRHLLFFTFRDIPLKPSGTERGENKSQFKDVDVYEETSMEDALVLNDSTQYSHESP